MSNTEGVDNHYRWIAYPTNFDPALKARYEKLADQLLENAEEPIAIVWAVDHEDWDDDNNNPDRNCLLVTQHVPNGEEWTFGNCLSSHRLYS